MKNKYLILTSIIIVIAALFLILDSKDENKNTTVKNTQKEKTQIITLKMAHNLPTNSALHNASVSYANLVKEKTEGKIQIDIYPKQELGNDYQMVELARNGEIDILLTPTAKMSVTVPSMQYADLPFIFPSREDAYSLLDGEVGNLILKDLSPIGLLGIAFWENGFKHFTGNSALLSPEDFEGKKIRVMKSRIIMEQFKALGATPIPIDFHSTKKALEDKVVDGQENPLVAIVNMNFHKVQSDLTLSEHAYLPYIFSISNKNLSKLPIDLQDVLISSALEITSKEREETQKREKEFLETIKNEGVNIHALSEENKKKFREKTSHITKMYEDVIGSHIISKTEEILYNKYNKEDNIIIGIDTDLSTGSKSSGLAIKRGVELAIDEINANGGILGKKVYAIAKDHKTISTKAIDNINEFMNNNQVKAIIGGKLSAIIATEIEYIQKGAKPYISPWASAAKIIENGYEENYLFRVSANNKQAVKRIYDEAMQNYKSPIVIVENSIWGRGALKLMEDFALNENKRLENIVVLNRGENDFTNIIEILKTKKIDSIIMVLNNKEGTQVVKTISKNNIELPLISHWGVLGGKFFKENKEYLKRNDFKLIQTFNLIKNKSEQVKKLTSAYLKKYGKKSINEIVAPNGVAQAYDATQLLALAMKKANSLEGEKIKESLENIEYYKGVVKTYENPFSKEDHEALEEKDFFFVTYNEDGILVPVGKR